MVNEDPNARIIRELRAEVDALREMLKNATGNVTVCLLYGYNDYTHYI